jgi:hypothetical protein
VKTVNNISRRFFLMKMKGLRDSRIQNKTVDGWKRARPQVLFHSPCVALECYVLVTCTRMSNTGAAFRSL